MLRSSLMQPPLASIMLAYLKNSPDSKNMSSFEGVCRSQHDGFPHDCLFKIAKLAKKRLDDYPILRPNMKQVVILLSKILLSSIEWEVTLAGKSQVFMTYREFLWLTDLRSQRTMVDQFLRMQPSWE